MSPIFFNQMSLQTIVSAPPVESDYVTLHRLKHLEAQYQSLD